MFVLETERLLLRPWRVSEAAVQHEMWIERDPRVPPHRRIGVDGRPSVTDVEGWIRDGSPLERLGLPALEVKATGDVVGYCGLIAGTDLPRDEPELAYELLRRAWGQGYATEAAGAVLDWARASGYRRLWATVREWNEASFRVLEKVGFARSGRVEADAEHGDSVYLTLVL
ncbi:GNAT family N-acetyltransferase [Promicromonospora sukumoe]|uniref:GNAT family N-acetyltransferase n=1 Tax=Promicromonospora sukumoe TaxID=88382 RepID=UPI0037CB5FE3